MAPEDPDGFDEARREDVFLRMAALPAIREREVLEATLTPLELAEHDLAAIIEIARQYAAGETIFPVTESNIRANADLIVALRRRVEELRGS